MSNVAHIENMIGQEPDPNQSAGNRVEEIRRPCIRSLYCKVFICAAAIAFFGLFTNFLIQCIGNQSQKDRIYSSVAAGVSICLSLVFSGIIICYRGREIDGCWLFTEFLRRHLQSARNNHPYRVITFEDSDNQNERGLGNVENQVGETNAGENNSDKNAEDGKNAACNLLTDTNVTTELLKSTNSSTARKVSEVASSVSLIAATAVAGEDSEVPKTSESTKPKEVPSATGTNSDKSSNAQAPTKSPYVISFVEYDSNDDFEYI